MNILNKTPPNDLLIKYEPTVVIIDGISFLPNSAHNAVIPNPPSALRIKPPKKQTIQNLDTGCSP